MQITDNTCNCMVYFGIITSAIPNTGKPAFGASGTYFSFPIQFSKSQPFHPLIQQVKQLSCFHSIRANGQWLVEPSGIEPLTSCLQSRRSPS